MPVTRLTVNTVRQVFANAESVGATIPKPIRDEHALLDALAEKTRHGIGLGDRLAAAVLDALASGSDPVTDQRVRDAVVAREISNSGVGLERVLGDRVVDFLRRHDDAILAGFVKPFDRAAASINTALGTLGKADLNDPRAILARGGDAAQAWADAQKAEETIKRIRDTYVLLGTVHNAYSVDPRYKVLVYADIPPNRFLDDGLASTQPPAWELAQRGYTLSLATPTALRARVAAVQGETETRQQRHADAFREAHRRTHGFGAVPQDAA